MSVALANTWTTERFLHWVVTQEGRYEFDGTAPVDMNGSTARHNRIAIRLITLLEARLRGTAFHLFALEAGVRVGNSVRYPDAVISGTRQPDTTRIITDVRVVFEVLSPSTARTDRVVKAQEYATVPSILGYALIDGRQGGITLLHRASGLDGWTSLPLTLEDTLSLPGLGVQFPVADLYDNVGPAPGPGGPV